MNTAKFSRNIFSDYFFSLIAIISYPISLSYKILLISIPFIVSILSLFFVVDFLYNDFSFSNENIVLGFLLIGLLFSTDISKLFYYIDIFILETLWLDYRLNENDLKKFSDEFIERDKQLDKDLFDTFLHKRIKFKLTNFQNKNLPTINMAITDKFDNFSAKICFYFSFPLFLLFKLHWILNH